MIASPAVSVLMAVHNGMPYVSQAIESILEQTLSDFEFIIVDDGSTDRSLRVLESYNDTRLRIIKQSTNLGLVKSLNFAAKLSRAPLIARMDADDIALPQRLQLQVSEFETQDDLVLLGSSYSVIDSSGRVIGSHSLPTRDEELRVGLLEGNKFAHPTVMMRTNAFRACGGYRDIGGRYAQDYDLWCRLAEHGRLRNLDLELLQYRVHAGQVSIDKLLHQREAAEIYRQLAIQRRTSGKEDLAAAKSIVASSRTSIRSECAAELLRQSWRLAKSGNQLGALRLKWRAFLIDPFSKSMRSGIGDKIYKIWMRIRRLA